ncbi:MAG: T9SS type A sorting domain-containing protein [Bacteroidales bacterium]|nr:T9SS type A sorting domain-containing protein [Bacteroidales bacterium]
MKKYFCLFLLLILSVVCLNAQNALPRTYEYDDAGNRILRKTVELRNEVAQTPVAAPATSATEAQAAYYEESLGDKLTARIYPNPTKGEVCLRFNRNVKEGYYQILNMSGQTVKQGSFESAAALIDFSAFPTGTYMLYLSADGQRDTWKVVKE